MIYHTYEAALEPSAGEAIRIIAASESWHPPLLGLSGSGHTAFLPDTHWLAGLVFHYGALANGEHWKYHIIGSTALQFCRMQADSEHTWHIDTLGLIHLNDNVRKLTVVIDLDTGQPDGGFLQLMDNEQASGERIVTLKQAASGFSVHVFPSSIPFRTTKVLSGTRNYMLGWLVGPSFI